MKFDLKNAYFYFLKKYKHEIAMIIGKQSK